MGSVWLCTDNFSSFPQFLFVLVAHQYFGAILLAFVWQWIPILVRNGTVTTLNRIDWISNARDGMQIKMKNVENVRALTGSRIECWVDDDGAWNRFESRWSRRKIDSEKKTTARPNVARTKRKDVRFLLDIYGYEIAYESRSFLSWTSAKRYGYRLVLWLKQPREHRTSRLINFAVALCLPFGFQIKCDIVLCTVFGCRIVVDVCIHIRPILISQYILVVVFACALTAHARMANEYDRSIETDNASVYVCAFVSQRQYVRNDSDNALNKMVAKKQHEKERKAAAAAGTGTMSK